MQLVLIPALSQISSIYASSNEGVRNLLELCIPREVVVLAEPCIDVAFNLSVEFYRQVFGEDVNASKCTHVAASANWQKAVFGNSMRCLLGNTDCVCMHNAHTMACLQATRVYLEPMWGVLCLHCLNFVAQATYVRMCGCQWMCSALTSLLTQRVTVTPLVLSLASPATPSVGLAPARQGSQGSAVTGASMGSTTSHKMAAEVSRDHMYTRGPVMLCAPSMSNPCTFCIALKQWNVLLYVRCIGQ